MKLISSCMLAVTSSVQNQMHQIQQQRSSHVPIFQATALLAVDDDAIQDSEDQAFLAAHNKVRLHHREPPFIWDSKLALYAREYAEKRKVDCNLIHSNGPYGENIFWGGGNQWAATDVVREHRYYDRATMKCKPGKMCGHYTQIVWRDSVRLGCARVQCISGDTFAICSYDPPGNYIGDNPFHKNSN